MIIEFKCLLSHSAYTFPTCFLKHKQAKNMSMMGRYTTKPNY